MKSLSDYCLVNMGQSPSSDTYNNTGDGLPFYQGNADFGKVHPIARVLCTEPIKTAEKGEVLISVRAPIGALNISHEKCCIGRGLASLKPYHEHSKICIYYARQRKKIECKVDYSSSTNKVR
jgi:type I restriction enzyme S subunit